MWFQTLPYDSEAPKISFLNGVLYLTGFCIPEDADDTLNPLFNELKDYLKCGCDITIIFKCDAINTSSSSKFVQLFSFLNETRAKDSLISSKRQINIEWHSPHSDEDMSDLGKFYKNYSDGLAKKGKYEKIGFKLKNYNYE